MVKPSTLCKDAGIQTSRADQVWHDTSHRAHLSEHFDGTQPTQNLASNQPGAKCCGTDVFWPRPQLTYIVYMPGPEGKHAVCLSRSMKKKSWEAYLYLHGNILVHSWRHVRHHGCQSKGLFPHPTRSLTPSTTREGNIILRTCFVACTCWCACSIAA